VELLLADALIVAGILFAIRWANREPARYVSLAAAIGSAIGFTLARNHYELEDSRFLWTLLAASNLALATTAGGSLVARQGVRGSLRYGFLAGVLVPILFVAYIAAALTLCLITNCDLS
jgi:hypothetical protein